MNLKNAGVADLLSQLQNQWGEAPEGVDEEEEFSIPQEMLDQLVWEEPQVAAPQQPASLPSFVTQPKSQPSFVTQPVAQPEAPRAMPVEDLEDKIPEWIPEGWQKDIPSFLESSKFQPLEDVPSFLKKEYPILKRSPINTIDDAHNLLVSLSKNNKDIFRVIDYVQDALEQIEIKRSSKILADVLGNAIGQLNTLSTDNQDIKKAIYILSSYFSSKIPIGYEERVNKHILSQTDKRERQPQVLTSKFLDPGTIFVRQKTIKIMKDQGLERDKAENVAQEEWSKIESFVDSISDNPEVQSIAKSTFVQHLLDGEGWEKAAEMSRRAAASGPDTAGIREQIRKASFDIEDIDDVINDLSNPEIVESQLEGSKVNNSELVRQVIEFGNTAKEIKYLIDNTEEGLDVSESVLDRIDNLSNKLISLSNDVLIHNPNELKSVLQEYEGDSVLEMIWWVQNNIISTVRKDCGSEGFVENPNLTAAELASAGLGIEDKRRKEKDTDAPSKKRVVDRRKQKEHDKKYHERAGDALLESKKQFHEKRKQNPEEEKDYKDRQFIRKKDYRLTQRELKAWEDLARNPVRVVSKLREIQKQNAQRTLDFYDRINQIWKYPDDIEKIKSVEANLIRNRTYRYKDLLDKLSEDPTADKTVLVELKKNIEEVPQYFEQARKIKLNENKVAEIIYYINSLLKFAKAS